MSANFNPYRKALYDIVTPILGGVVTLMNVLELYFIIKGPKRNRNGMGTVYILNLCISDAFVGIVMIVLKGMTPAINTTLKGNVIAENFYDVIHYCFIRMSLFVSVFNLVALTLDRVWAVTNPFSHRKRTKKFAVKVCILVWVLSFAVMTVVYCISRFTLKDIERYNTLVFPVATYTGTIIFVICYTKIYFVLKKSGQDLGRSKGAAKLDDSVKQQIEENRSEMRFLRLAVKTVAVFMLCWIPFSTASVLRGAGLPFGGVSTYSTFFVLAYFNSVLNPFIYFQHVWKKLSKHWNRYKSMRSKSAKRTSATKETSFSAVTNE